MCSEIHRLPNSLLRMSGEDNPQVFLLEKKEQDQDQENPVSSETETETEIAVEDKEKEIQIKEEDEKDHVGVATISSRQSEKQIIIEDDENDGFKTPTSSDHKIPPITECPGAPMKPRSQTLKRKASPPPRARRSLQFDAASSEIESIFRPTSSEDNVEEKKLKKARKDGEEDD